MVNAVQYPTLVIFLVSSYCVQCDSLKRYNVGGTAAPRSQQQPKPQPLSTAFKSQQQTPGAEILKNQLKFLTNQPFNEFDWKLSKILDKNEKENFVVSPISVKLALGMLYLGVEGTAAKEIADAFQVNSSIKEAVIEKFSRILLSLEQSERNEYELNVGTKLFVDSSAKIVEEFKKQLQNYYNSTIETVDFKHQPESATDTVNEWCDAVTKGKISHLITKGDVQDGTIMMLLNAIYFRGEWETQFPEQDTKLDTFWVSSKKQVTTSIMSVKNTFYYYNATELKAHIIRLPYVGKKFAMYLIVPHGVDDLSTLTKQIDPTRLAQALDQMKEQSLHLRLPKFEFESTSILVPVLKELGIKELFSPTANLNNVGSSPHGPLMVSSILQKSGIAVNEKGAVGYAATEVLIASRFGETFLDVHATHPFIFLIADESKDTIIFTGKVLNPQAPSNGLENKNTFDELPNPIETALGDKLNYFDKELLKKLTNITPGNIVLSPASIKSALGLLLEGAKGTTEQELRDALRLPDEKENGNQLLHNIQKSLKKKSPTVELEVHSKIFLAEGEKLNRQYEQSVKDYYGTEIRNVNFLDSEKASKSINDWVKNATNGMIPTLVKKDDFEPSTRIFLANCIFFKGEWANEFDPKLTKPDFFCTQPDVCQKTYFMNGEKDVKYHYSKPLEAKIVEIPFKDSRFSMVLMLPEKTDGIYNLIKNLQHHSLTTLLSFSRKHSVELSIPRFEIEFTSSLSKVLQLLDIKSIFTKNANLSGILEIDSPIAVSEIIHKAKIEVNEKGAKAAAASGVQVVLLSAPINYEFKADHPFLFFIRDAEISGFLFEGIIVQPEKVTEGTTRTIPPTTPVTVYLQHSQPSTPKINPTRQNAKKTNTTPLTPNYSRPNWYGR